jgi:hypothetical protein
MSEEKNTKKVKKNTSKSEKKNNELDALIIDIIELRYPNHEKNEAFKQWLREISLESWHNEYDKNRKREFIDFYAEWMCPYCVWKGSEPTEWDLKKLEERKRMKKELYKKLL